MTTEGRFSTSGRFPMGQITTWEETEHRRGSVGYRYTEKPDPFYTSGISFRENLAKLLVSMGHEVPEHGPYCMYVRPGLSDDELSQLLVLGFPLYQKNLVGL